MMLRPSTNILGVPLIGARGDERKCRDELCKAAEAAGDDRATMRMSGGASLSVAGIDCGSQKTASSARSSVTRNMIAKCRDFLFIISTEAVTADNKLLKTA